MKINKLFHWLYAFIMFLPILFFIGSLLFNYFHSDGILDIVTTIDTQFSSIWSLPLFAWAKSSFLIEPFVYISGLFGLSSDNLIVVALDYWLSISIIWLVFDLIMYVPMLVHSWIDKGAIK